MSEKLNQKESNFIENYVSNGFSNATEAYIQSYETNNRNTAKKEAHKLLQKNKIQKGIEQAEFGYKHLARAHGVSRVNIILKLKEIIMGKKEIIDESGKTIQEPKYDGKTINSAITTLCKLTGDFAPQKQEIEIESSGLDVDVSKLNPEELEELRLKLLANL